MTDPLANPTAFRTYTPKVGEKVLFGRSQGEQTRGTVMAVNRTKAKIRQDEQRGAQKSHPIGTIWTVPFNLMSIDPSGGISNEDVKTQIDTALPAEDTPLPMFLKPGDNGIMIAITEVYGALSPENLSCDGEAPRHVVEQKRREYNAKLALLFKAFGRPVSETLAYKWAEQNKTRV